MENGRPAKLGASTSWRGGRSDRMNILLIQPPIDSATRVLWPPVGLGYLATALRRDGHEVFLLDCARERLGDKEFVNRVLSTTPEMVGFSVYTLSVPCVRRLASLVRAHIPGATIVIGGPHISALPDRALRDIPHADYAIRGEGEMPLCLLANGGDKVPAKILGPHFAPNIEDYGIPAWDLIRPHDYAGDRGMEHAQVPVFFSRGCPFPCTFCAAKVTSGQRLRVRSYDHIFTELTLLQRNYGIRDFIIYDEGFGTSKKFIMGFCAELLRRRFDGRLHFGTGVRLDQIDEELLAAVAACNFDRLIALGIESGSQRVLDAMKKRTTLAMIREKVLLMDRMGFQPCGFFILGYPGETRAEMEQTVKLALDLPLRQASFTAFMPLPATEATRQLIESGELPADYDFNIGNGAIAYAPQGMTRHQLQRIRRTATLRFYARPRILFPIINSGRNFRRVLVRALRLFLEDKAA